MFSGRRYAAMGCSLLAAAVFAARSASAQMVSGPYSYDQDPPYGYGQGGGMQPFTPTDPRKVQDPGSSPGGGQDQGGDPGGGQSSDGEASIPFSGVDLRRITARQQAGGLWRRFSPQRRGLLAAGKLLTAATPVTGESMTAQGWSLWLDGAFSRMRDRNPARASKGYSIGSTLGLDRMMTPETVIGFGVNHTYSNSRGTLAQSRERTHNTFASLYLSHQFTDWLSVDVQGGYVYQRQRRRLVTGGGTAYGKRHSHGYLISGALNAWKWLSPQVMLSGRVGIIASRDRWRAYTEYGPMGVTPRLPQTEALVQGVVETGVSWWLEPVMPRLSVSYNRDLYRKGVTLPGDRDDFTLSGGLAWFGSGDAQGLSFDVGAEVILGRQKQRDWGISASLKWSW